MSEIKDRQDAASDIDPIVAALADDMANDSWAAAAVEGIDEAADPVESEAESATEAEEQPALEADALDLSDDSSEAGEPLATAEIASDDEAVEGEPLPAEADDSLYPAIEAGELAADADADFDDEAPAELIASDDIADAIEAALLDEAPLGGNAPAVEPLAATAFEHMPAAYADTIVELDAPDSADDDAPLLDGDLEHGIASVFAALHAAREDAAPVEPLGDLEAAEGVTFRLLGELDRLWHRAA